MLTAEQTDQFWRDGFLAVRNVLTSDEVEALRCRTDDIITGAVPYPDQYIQLEPVFIEGRAQVVDRRLSVRKIWELTRHDAVFREYAFHPKIVGMVQALLGPDLKLYGDQMFLKPPFHGSEKPFHQDSPYWDIEPMNLVTCWMALDESTLENGCMRFLPGTHKGGPLPHRHLSGPHIVPEGYEEFDLSQEVAVELQPGDCTLHHSLVLHQSTPNRSASPRRGLTTAYMSAQSRWIGTGEKPEYLLISGREHPGCV
jgi:phytanoyl-CoA hydroxylase